MKVLLFSFNDFKALQWNSTEAGPLIEKPRYFSNANLKTILWQVLQRQGLCTNH